MKKKIRVRTVLSLAFVLVALAGAALVLRFVSQKATSASYPVKYEREVQAASEKYGVEKALIYGVIKTESNFDPNARSHAEAIGLMQLTEETFEWVRNMYKDDAERVFEDLYDPAVNIDYGTHLLSILLDIYENEDTALCAYNAGMGIVNEWLSDPQYSDDGKTLLAVPYDETDNYRKKVAQNKSIYKELYFKEESAAHPSSLSEHTSQISKKEGLS